MIKITKTLVMALSILLLTANVYASKVVTGDYSHRSDIVVIKTVPVDTKTEAYALGNQKLKDLKLKSASELSDIFKAGLNSPAERKSVTLENAIITVQEFMDEQGRIQYRGDVHVTYHYSVDNERFD